MISIFNDSLNHYGIWGNRIYSRGWGSECAGYGPWLTKLGSHLQYSLGCAAEWEPSTDLSRGWDDAEVGLKNAVVMT